MRKRFFPAIVALVAVGLAAATASAGTPIEADMTGGGFISDSNVTGFPNTKANIAVRLECPAPTNSRRPVLVAHFGNDYQLRLETLTESECTLNDPLDPSSGGVLEGSGTATCNGEAATLTFGLGDSVDVRGLGAIDAVDLQIDGSARGCQLVSLSGPLLGGNLTLHAR
jgi:hypothetical protein